MTTPIKLILFGSLTLLVTGLFVMQNGASSHSVFSGLIARPSNCGGNSGAMNVCKEYSITIRLIQMDLTNEFNLLELAPTNKAIAANAAQSHWIPNANFLIKTNIDFKNPGNELAIVCATVFDNIPQPTFWNGHRKTPAHAVGYLDGRTELISPKDFKVLDLSSFVSATTLGEAP